MSNKIILFCLLVVLGLCEGGYQNVKIKEFMSQNQDIFAYITEVLDMEAGTDYFLWKVESVQTQLVSGMNYKVVVDYQRKEDPNQYLQYEIIIYDQPWTNTRKVVSINEENMRVDDKRNKKFHGWANANVKQFMEKHQGISNLFLSKLIPKFELDLDTSIIEIKSVKEQFVQGRTFLVFMELSDGKHYKGTLYENPWNKKIEVINVELDEEI